MRPNQGFRVAYMAARTNKTGTELTVTGKRGRTTLSEFETDRLCRWLISLLEIDVAIQEAALGRLAASIERIATQMGHVFAQGQIAAKAGLVPVPEHMSMWQSNPSLKRKLSAAGARTVVAIKKRHKAQRTKHEKQRRKRSR